MYNTKQSQPFDTREVSRYARCALRSNWTYVGGVCRTIKWSFAGHIARNITAWLRLEVGVLRQPEFEERDTIHERRLHRKLRQRRTQADVPGRKGIALGSNRSNRQLINEMQREAEVTAGTRSSRPVRWKGTRYIISDEHRFVYLAIPKVASTSMLNSLLPFFDLGLDSESLENLKNGIPLRRAHEKYSRSRYQIHKAAFLSKMADRQYDGYFKFTFVRNPWDRLLSCYMSKVVRSGTGMPMGKYGNVTLRRDMSFQEFAEAVCLISDEEANPHFRSQHIFVCDEGADRKVLAILWGASRTWKRTSSLSPRELVLTLSCHTRPTRLASGAHAPTVTSTTRSLPGW